MRVWTQLSQGLDRSLGTSLAPKIQSWKNKRKIRRKWRRAAQVFPVPKNVYAEIREVLSEIEFFWTPPAKQIFLANLIVANNLKRVVEIGVYTGGSFVPQVLAVKQTGGSAVGIDPYSDVANIQEDNREMLTRVDPALSSPDWEGMYQSLLDLLERHELSPISQILRMTSNDAANIVAAGIDLLHIDGNHDFDRVMDDLVSYMPKLRKGGFLVLDDINWPTIAPLYNQVKRQMRVVHETDTWGCCQMLDQPIELYDPRKQATAST